LSEPEESTVSELQEVEDQGSGITLTRREAVTMGLALAGGTLAAGSARSASAAVLRQATPVPGTPGDQAEAIIAIARDIMDKQDVKAVIVRVPSTGRRSSLRRWVSR
jgi:hypothetical protein